MLASAAEHYRNQQRIIARGVVVARRYRRNPRRLVEAVTAFQILAARDAIDGVDSMLGEQGIDSAPVAAVSATAMAGTASDGRALATLFEQATTDYWFGLMVATQLKDVARMAAGTAMVARPNVGGYTRMLNPPSCSRCAVLAGKFFRWNAGFDRHPGCDCIHVPTRSAEAAASEGLLLDQSAYFDSLSPAEQDRTFTKAGAQAIRDGADMGQVVNARRGMAPAQIGGRDVLLTTEGTTRRGLAYRGLTRGADTDVRTGGRYRRANRPRLMPETIYAAAPSREEALRLLRLHGYLL